MIYSVHFSDRYCSWIICVLGPKSTLLLKGQRFMGNRIARGWELVKESWAILRQDKELMLFPILSSIACILVAASFAVPFLLVPDLGRAFMQQKDQAQANGAGRIIGYVLAFAYYFVNYFVIVFFNVALVSCALIRFRGGNPTLGDGIGAACQRLPQIFAWSLLAATVGMLLRTLEERLSFLGRIVVGFIGLAWSLAIYFVVPVLAAERVGPLEAVKRSSKTLMKTWGESLVGNISMGMIGFLFALPGVALMVVAFAVGAAAQSIVLGIAIGACAVIYLVFLSVVMTTLQQIFLAGTYLYAAEGTVPPGFKEELLREAFRRK
jgi:hypothetical protein